MPRWTIALDAKLKEYEAYLRARRRREETIREYRRLIVQAFRALREAGLCSYPRSVGEEEISYLYNELYAGLDPHVARTQLSIIGTFLKRMAANPVVENMGLEWPQGDRTTVRWLDPLQAVRLMRAAEGMERILVHFELCCLMRRCEVLRLSMQDLRDGAIVINGKGRSGGKRRTIPYHPRTWEELEKYQTLRERTIASAKARNPTVKEPEGILVYARGGRLGTYAETAVDSMVKRAAARAGIDPTQVSNHVLRRTGARILKLSGTPTITITHILGHSSERQTLEYIGWRLNDMADGMQMMQAYMSQLEERTAAGTKRG